MGKAKKLLHGQNKLFNMTHTICGRTNMKELYMLAGFGLGLLTGVMLYKYSKETKKTVDKAEQAVMKEAEMMSKKAEQATEKIEEGIKQGTKKIQKKISGSKKSN